MEKSYKEYLEHITTFIFDVDGVLTNGSILITSDGEELRNMNIKDGFAIRAALNKGFKVCIISSGRNKGVKKRMQYLDVKDIYLEVKDKLKTLEKYVAKHQLKYENIIYVGDDLPDYPAMNKVGLPCAPQDAVPEIKAISKYVSHKKGGKGCVRDIIEQVLKVQGKWI